MKKICILATLVLLTACATTYTMRNTAPPKAGVPVVHRVAVMPFDGDKGNYVSTSLAAMLPRLHYQGSKAYDVLNRDSIKEILNEQQFQMTIADPETMIEFGLLAGIEGGFTGSVSYKESIERFREEHSKIVDNKTVKYYAQCVNNKYDISISTKLTDYSTSRIVYSKTLPQSITNKKCDDWSSARSSVTSFGSSFRSGDVNYTEHPSEAISVLRDSDDPYVIMSNNVLREIAKDLGEYTVSMNATVAKKEKSITNKDDEARFKSAAEYMEKGNVGRACEEWNSLAVKYPRAPYLTYNLGLCAEIAGDLTAALDYYNAADRYLGSSDNMISSAISRIKLKQSKDLK